MPTRKSPRKGSLQFWPRKRATKILPRVNWKPLSTIANDKKIKGFIAYKAGMKSAILSDNTPDSLTKGKHIAVPVTILECPPIKIFSIRFYKNDIPVSEVLAPGLDKELKKKLKIPKEAKKKIEDIQPESYEDVQLIVYSVVKKTGIKKNPDLIEIALSGSKEEKLAWVKENLGKEISISDIFQNGDLIDTRGLTRGKGFQGSMKRFGLKLRFHKSEKGRRGAGSIAPWHPARVTFRNPMSGQMGMFTRIVYNNKIIALGKMQDTKEEVKKFLTGIKSYGDVKTDYIIIKGSVQGPSKRQLVITPAMRPNKSQGKLNYEFIELK